MKVLFINENTLGHASYLLPYVDYFRTNPQWRIDPVLLNATPLPSHLGRRADRTIRLLRRFDLDFHHARWRMVVSGYVAQAVRAACQQVDLVMANTQSTALRLETAAPLVVALDATFRRLRDSAWFSPNPLARVATRWTTRNLIRTEQALFRRAQHLLPWSGTAAEDLAHEYAVPPEKVTVLGPAVRLPPPRPSRPPDVPRILFMGGDFRRKGGETLLNAFRQRFAGRCRLDIVTHSPLLPEAGVEVHQSVKPWSPEWEGLWQRADVFVFPSRLETFGIVVLEALAFQVPVVATPVGAVPELLAGGRAGYLVEAPDALGPAIDHVLHHPEEAAAKAALGYARVQANHSMDVLGPRLARLLERLASGPRTQV
jgi:glycosyltransferase involved in cell wall biosynthesis